MAFLERFMALAAHIEARKNIAVPPALLSFVPMEVARKGSGALNQHTLKENQPDLFSKPQEKPHVLLRV